MAEPSMIRSLWYRWKSLRLPWRKQWLCGYDLAGTTFWEFQSQLSSRPRRIAKYPGRIHHGDVRLTPAWIQWLRHTRHEAPTIEEQQLEVGRQEQMLQLAADADRRWKEKESYLDRPEDTGQSEPLLQPQDAGGYSQTFVEEDGKQGMRSSVGTQEQITESIDSSDSRGRESTQERGKSGTFEEQNPWKIHRGALSEEWQPESWSPSRAQRR